jgi:hypothetical protein
MQQKEGIIPSELIASKIYIIRRLKVMLDRDLAQLYGVETRVLNQAVKRNSERFPDDFMIKLTRDEVKRISQFVTSSDIKTSHKRLVTSDKTPRSKSRNTPDSSKKRL